MVSTTATSVVQRGEPPWHSLGTRQLTRTSQGMTSPRFPPRYYRTIPSNEEFSGFKQIPRRMIMIWGERRYGRGEKILEIENQAGARRRLSLRSVLLLVLLVGVGVGATAYA